MSANLTITPNSWSNVPNFSYRFASLIALIPLALHTDAASAATPWEQHRGDCDSQALSDPENVALPELSRCVRLLAVYRPDLLDLRGSYRQRVIIALRRVSESGQGSVAETAKYFLHRMAPATTAIPESEPPQPHAAVAKDSETPLNSDASSQDWLVLASDERGLVAIDVSGKRTRLFESAAPIDSLAYDRAKEIVWYVSNKQLWALDLRVEDFHPVIIATGLPVTSFAISGWSTVSAGLEDYEGAGRYNLDLHRYPVIELLPKPKVQVGEVGAEDRSESATSPAVIKRIKLVGTVWLTSQAQRPNIPASPVLEVPSPVTLPQGEPYGCEDSELCGQSSHVGGTGLELVLVGHACGDSCHTSCLLYDRSTKRFASTLDGVWGNHPTPSSCEVQVAPDHSQYIVERSHCLVAGRQVSCRGYVDVTILGWIRRDDRSKASRTPFGPANPTSDAHRFEVALDWLLSVRKLEIPRASSATLLTYEGGVESKKCIRSGTVSPHTEPNIVRMSCFYDAVRDALSEEFFDEVGSGFDVEGSWASAPPGIVSLEGLARSLNAGNFRPRTVPPTSIPKAQRAVLQRLQSTKGEIWTFFRIFKPMMGAGGPTIVVGTLDSPEGPKVAAVLLFE